MLAFFKRPLVFAVIGLIVLLLLIWFFGDYFELLATAANRLIAMMAVVTLFALWQLFKTARATQANNRLAAAVVDQAKGDQRPSADVVQLRERFEEAVANLKQQKKRGGQGLYELPWYVIIGAPGSGKTTALKYSGLKFPLEQRSGRNAMRGVGGTRNCDWWFTEEAVLLDTAGRYTTQDSDASADSAGWAEFLALLKKYRKRRPLNGVLLTISAQDLLTQGQAGREAHVAAARRRLNELNKELRIQLPVYLLVTKCDLLAGFTEYFDDMSAEDRTQVLGMTFPQDVTQKGEAAAHFPAEFDAVVQRLNERVFTRLEDERDPRRRAKAFGFPQQLAALRESLAEFVADVFESTRFDQRVLLRGVYFTSGTQEGTPIDRLLGTLGRRFAVSESAVAPTGPGKAYFIERLLKQVVLAESGLAGVSRRLELQKAAAQFGLYIGLLAAGALLLIMFTYSYRTNGAFLDAFKVKVAETRQDLPAPGDSAIASRPRLDRVRALVDVVSNYQNDTSWFSRGWGLDQSGPIETAVRDFYRQELNQALVTTVRVRLEERLRSLIDAGDPLDLYLTLRAYLMLKDTSASYFREGEVRDVARKEWASIYKGRDEEIAQLDEHFGQLLAAGLPSSEINTDLVERARGKIPEDAAPRLILARATRLYDEQNPSPGPLFGTPLFRDTQRRPLGEDIPRIFTAEGFKAAKDGLIKDTEKQFSEETWVWEGKPPKQASRQEEVWRLYEDKYIEHWLKLLKDIGLARAPSGPALIELINKLTAEREGLKSFLQTVEHHTFLVPPPDAKPPDSMIGSIGAWISNQVSSFRGKVTEPGAKVTFQFASIHLLVTEVGGKVAIDEVLAKLKDVGTKLGSMDPSKVGGDVNPQAALGLSQSASALSQSAGGFPGAAASISDLISELGGAATKTLGGQVADKIRTEYANALSLCRETISNRYPFNRSSTTDVAPADLAKVFGSSGEFSRFAREVLRDYVEGRPGQYAAKPMPDGKPLNIESILAKVNAAERISESLFVNGEPKFKFDLSVRDLDPGSLRFELDGILFPDGQRLVFEFTRRDPKPGVWPTKPGELRAQFVVDQTGRSQGVRGGDGPWTFFRLIDQGTLDRINETNFDLTLRSSERWAKLRIVAESKSNPLNLMIDHVLDRFNCDR